MDPNLTEMMDKDPSLAVAELREGFSAGLLTELDSRKNALRTLRQMLIDHEDDFATAIFNDLGRSRSASLITIDGTIKSECNFMLKHMDSLLKDQPIPSTGTAMFDTLYVQRQPLGVVLIIGSWNYPAFTTLCPLMGVIAAGNTVLIKPSEYCPHFSKLIAKLISDYMDKKICQVVLGDATMCKKLLASERFDHILYTGGSNGGRAVYEAAAKFLTPVTLELGGKCPVYVDSQVDFTVAAKRIIYMKTTNCGQVCIAPDYVICHRDMTENLISAMGECLKEFFGEDAEKSADFAHIINEMHWNRVTQLLSKSKGKIVYGGQTDASKLYIAPTVVKDVKPDDSLMSEEIFGPILPILQVDSAEEAIAIIRSMDPPLAVYVFTNDKDTFSKFKTQTTSGALLQNDCSLHILVPELPFGGVGASGIGRYRGKYSIDTFSNLRSVMLRGSPEFVNQWFFYPPTDDRKLSWMRWLLSSSDKKTCSIL